MSSKQERRGRIARRGGALMLVLLLVACAPVILANAKSSSSSKKPKKVSTAKALKKAGWQSNVKVSFSEGSFRFRSDGVPKQGIEAEYATPNPGVVVPNETNSHVSTRAQVIHKQAYNFKITTEPRKAKKVTDVFTGPVGVTINGGLVFNPYEGDGTTVAMASNFYLTDKEGHEVAFLDKCNGHPSPGPVYAYHYHGLPECVTKLVDKKKKPSHIIGVAFDGFPIYGDRDVHGHKVKASQLDKCNGITSPTPEFPKGIYHYVLLNVPNKHSSIDCFRGEVKMIPGPKETYRPAVGGGGTGIWLCHLPTEGPASATRPGRP
jgi:hypothetical protein